MCKGIAETWLANMAGAPLGYDEARPAPARACKGTAGLDLNMPGKHARSTDTMHARPRTGWRMCKGIAETWLDLNMPGTVGYASAARTSYKYA